MRAEPLIPLTWATFIIFLQKNLNETQVFVDNIWKKFYNTNQYQLENIMDQSAFIEHLQSISKEFNGFVTYTNNLIIWYFPDDFKPSIYRQLNKRNCNLDDQQAIFKGTVDAKVKAACQAFLLMQKSDTNCPHSHKPPKYEESNNQKDSKIQKNHTFVTNNHSKNSGQSGQASG